MTTEAPPYTRPSAVPSWLGRSSRRRRTAWVTLLVIVLTVVAGVGVFGHRVHQTTLVDSGEGYAANTPSIYLPYGGGSRYVVDDSVSTLHPIMFSVTNSGPDTITLQGVNDFLSGIVAGFKVSRLPRNGGFSSAQERAPRTALRGTTVRPGQQIGLWMDVKGKGCASGTGGIAETLSTVPVTVSIDGITRVEWVALPMLVTVMSPASEQTPSDPRSCLRSDAAPAAS